MALIVTIAAIGYLVAFLPARLTHLDIGRFRRTLWTGIAHRDQWLRAVRFSYLALGWPSLAVAIAWRTSRTRRALVELRDQMRATEHRKALTPVPRRTGIRKFRPRGEKVPSSNTTVGGEPSDSTMRDDEFHVCGRCRRSIVPGEPFVRAERGARTFSEVEQAFVYSARTVETLHRWCVPSADPSYRLLD